VAHRQPELVEVVFLIQIHSVTAAALRLPTLLGLLRTATR
jgi:hypothetical protein